MRARHIDAVLHIELRPRSSACTIRSTGLFYATPTLADEIVDLKAGRTERIDTSVSLHEARYDCLLISFGFGDGSVTEGELS